IDLLAEELRARAIDRPRLAQERLEQAHRAERQRDREAALAVDEHRELRRAAADVDEERAPIVQREPAHHRELNEARLLDPFDHLELDARLTPRPLDERRPV